MAIKKPINRPSQVTKKAPSKRLVNRRKKNTKSGYFPNPVKKSPIKKDPFKFVVEKASDAGFYKIAKFANEHDAADYARAYAEHHKVSVRVMG